MGKSQGSAPCWSPRGEEESESDVIVQSGGLAAAAASTFLLRIWMWWCMGVPRTVRTCLHVHLTTFHCRTEPQMAAAAMGLWTGWRDRRRGVYAVYTVWFLERRGFPLMIRSGQARTIGSDPRPAGVAIDSCHRRSLTHGNRWSPGVKSVGMSLEKDPKRTLKNVHERVPVLCGGWVSETRGLGWPAGENSVFDDLSDGSPGEQSTYFPSGANAPGWVVPRPVSDLNCRLWRGAVRNHQPQLGCGRKRGAPNIVPRRLGLPVTARLHVCYESIFDPVPKRAMQMRVGGHSREWVRRLGGELEGKSRREALRRQGCVGKMPRTLATPPQPPTSSRRLDFLCDPLSAWVCLCPSSAVATRLSPLTPAPRKDTWEIGVLVQRADGRAETWSPWGHGAMA
jgi:hypothetical protein